MTGYMKLTDWGEYRCELCGYTYHHVANAPLRQVWHYMCPRRISGKGGRLVPMIKIEEAKDGSTT